MSHESENSKTSAVVTHEYNTANIPQDFIRNISEFEPEPVPLSSCLYDPTMVVLTRNASVPISDTQVRIIGKFLDL